MNTVKKDHSVGEGSGALAGAVAGVAVATLGFTAFPAFTVILEGLIFRERIRANEVLLVALVWHLALLNQAPTSAYFAQTLQIWEQGRFIRFYGLGQWLAGFGGEHLAVEQQQIRGGHGFHRGKSQDPGQYAWN